MVSTRHHPKEFPPVEASPTKNNNTSPRKRTVSPSTTLIDSPNANGSPSTTMSTRTLSTTTATKRALSSSSTLLTGWSHTASNLTLLWLLIALPLTIWDCLYMLLRPHTMAGGILQYPIWKPYEIYAKIDYVYGWPGWENNDGFGGAQAVLNGVECVLYGLYVAVVWKYGEVSVGGRGVQIGEGVRGWFAGGRRVSGKSGNRAVLIGFSAAVMTLSKTVLYYFNEYFSHFENVGHNDWFTLFIFYGVMNGLWVIFPAYMTIVFGADILEALDLASESPSAAAKKKY